MINNGVPQMMVQQYLGHASPEMTARYAHIHHDTLKKAFIEYQRGLSPRRDEQTRLEAQWLKNTVASQALPNGLCALPLTQPRCPHANACLTCVNFRTTPDHLPHHKAQLEHTVNIIDQANEKGCSRIVEMNREVAEQLTAVIHHLEEDQHEQT